MTGEERKNLSGERESFSVDRWHVPKRDLMQGLAVLFEGSGPQVEPRLPEGETLGTRNRGRCGGRFRIAGGICLEGERSTTIW
jgi:hypothetical protein